MTENVGFRCPNDLIAIIKQQMESTSRGKTDVLVDMLRSALPSRLLSERSQLPEEKAFYIVWSDTQLLYVGVTDNLNFAFRVAHLRLGDFLRVEGDVRVSWLPGTAENLAAFDKSLIDELSPELDRATSNRLRQFCQETGKTRSEVLGDALAAYFGEPAPVSEQISYEKLELMIQAMKERLTAVESRLDAGGELVGELVA